MPIKFEHKIQNLHKIKKKYTLYSFICLIRSVFNSMSAEP